MQVAMTLAHEAERTTGLEVQRQRVMPRATPAFDFAQVRGTRLRERCAGDLLEVLLDRRPDEIRRAELGVERRPRESCVDAGEALREVADVIGSHALGAQ